MAKITINGKDYDTDALSEEARRQLGSVIACDRRLEELDRQTAMTRTARNAYGRALATLLEKETA